MVFGWMLLGLILAFDNVTCFFAYLINSMDSLMPMFGSPHPQLNQSATFPCSRACHLQPNIGCSESHSQLRLNLFSALSGLVQMPAGKALLCSTADPIWGLVCFTPREWKGKQFKSSCQYCSPLAPIAQEEVADPEKCRIHLFDGIEEIYTRQ